MKTSTTVAPSGYLKLTTIIEATILFELQFYDKSEEGIERQVTVEQFVVDNFMFPVSCSCFAEPLVPSVCSTIKLSTQGDQHQLPVERRVSLLCCLSASTHIWYASIILYGRT